MSRSTRKAFITDKGCRKEDYWRVYRRYSNQVMKLFTGFSKKPCHAYWHQDDEPEFKNPKELINDYDYSDWRFDLENDKDPYWESERVKWRRK